MFKGTRRYAKGEIDHITASMGGSNNAFTSLDSTAYYFSFASDRWWPALEIEADRITHTTLDPEELELERGVILEEIKMDLDTPWGALRQVVETTAFNDHPYRFPVIGSPEDVAGITRDQLLTHYRRYYQPGNAVLVVAGDFNPVQAMARIEALFGDLVSHQVPERPVFTEPPGKEQVRLELRRPTETARILAAFPAPSARQPEQYCLHLLDALLAQGKRSRLYRRMVDDEGVVSGVHTDFTETLDPYLFFVSLELQQERELDRVEELLFEEIETLMNDLVPEEELTRAKNHCLVQFLCGFETSLDQAMQLGLAETLDLGSYWSGYSENIRSVTSRQIREMAASWWARGRTTVGRLFSGRSEG